MYEVVIPIEGTGKRNNKYDGSPFDPLFPYPYKRAPEEVAYLYL